MSARIRLGMIGGGQGAFIGAVHRIAARLDDRYELVAGAFSADPDRARASASALHVASDRAYGSWQAMVTAETARPDGVEAVAVVTPNHLHADPVIACLKAGLHVICDKPLSHTMEAARRIECAARGGRSIFALTHNYTGYPMVRQARAMVAEGAIGAVRVVQAEYPQEWLTTPLEATGHKQAAWRTDPAQSGDGGSIGDIGTHAFNLAEFVTSLRVERLAADLTSFVPGRRLDDNAHILLRFEGGARGMLWCSQVAPGNENALRLRVYGDQGSLEWAQEAPDALRHARLGEALRLIRRGGGGASAAAAPSTRLPAGHPEGYLEAFAQLYRDVADQIIAARTGVAPDPATLLVPGLPEAMRGMRFIAAAVASARSEAGWVALDRA